MINKNISCILVLIEILNIYLNKDLIDAWKTHFGLAYPNFIYTVNNTYSKSLMQKE